MNGSGLDLVGDIAAGAYLGTLVGLYELRFASTAAGRAKQA